MLGAASSNTGSMSPVRRWKRLTSPHGVRQLPKSAVSRSATPRERLELLARRAGSGCTSSVALHRLSAAAAAAAPSPQKWPGWWRPSSPPSGGPRRAGRRSARPVRAFSGSPAGSASQAATRGGSRSSKAGSAGSKAAARRPLEREARRPLEQAQGVDAARVLADGVHVAREIGRPAGCSARPPNHGPLLVFTTQPLGGFTTSGSSSSACSPCQSVAGSAPSTGWR